MVSRALFFLAALALVAGSAPLAAESIQVLKNEKVRVVEDKLAPGESETIADGRPSALVYFAGQKATLAFAGGSARQQSVKRGKTVAEPATLRKLTNTGATPLDLVRVEFLSQGSPQTWGREGLAPNYKLLFEDRYSRAYDIRIAAHAREPLHTHHDRIVVCLSGAKLEHILPGGHTQPSTLKTGEVVWRPGQTHVGHNLGDTDLWVIAIEPK